MLRPILLLCFTLSLFVPWEQARAACDLSGLSANATAIAELDTSVGSICIELYGDDAPLHVANFDYYVAQSLLTGTVFHRHVPGFVMQGGSHRVGASDFEVVPPDNGPVTNEPCALDTPSGSVLVCSERGNERGTVALAKLGGDPNSGTTGWFINLTDNRENLDNQNGGFTVFGRVLDMAPVDALAAMPVSNDDDAVWLQSSVFPAALNALSGLSTPLPLGPFYGTPYGCFDPADQVTVLAYPQLNVGLPDPTLFPNTLLTLSAGCGTATTPSTFIQDPGPPECPDPDLLGVRTDGPFSPNITPNYFELSCSQAEEALNQRILWQTDFQSDFYGQLVTIDSANVPEPSLVPGLFAGILLLRQLSGRRSQ